MITPSDAQLRALLELAFGDEVSAVMSTSLDEIRLAMAVVQPVDEEYTVGELAMAVVSGVTQIARLSFPDPDRSRAFAVAVFEWTISRNGYESELTPEQILGLLDDVESSISRSPDRLPHRVDEACVQALARTLRPGESGRWRGSQVRAYVVSALTGLEPEDEDQVKALGDTIDLILEETGIWTHTPARYTNPNDDDHAPPMEIHDLDYELLLKADLVVALMDWPTTGGGQELAWLQDTGGPLIIVAREETKVSRLVLGTPVDMRRIDRGTLAEELNTTVDALAGSIEGRQARRLRIRSDYGGRVASMREMFIDLEESPFDESIPERLVEQALRSPHHYANAPTWLAETIQRKLSDEPGVPRVLQGNEVAALARYIRRRALPIARLERLYRAAVSMTSAADKNRIDFRDEKAWEALDRSLGR